ncbi:MAG: lamin tail domain-containing protein, partial [Bacteroidales bacterium]
MNMKRTAIFAIAISVIMLTGACVKDELREPVTPDNNLDNIVINELLTANNEPPLYFPDGTGEGYDWVELYNAGNTEVDVSGVFLADEAGKLKAENQLPGGTTIPAGGFLVVLCGGNTSLSDTLVYVDMKLSAKDDGDNHVFLYDPLGVLIDQSAAFGYESGIGSSGQGLDDEKSLGRYPDGDTTWMVFDVPTPGTENYVPPPINEENIFINEFMCDNENFVPDDYGEYDDWIEIYNPGPEAVDIGGWYITDNLDDPKAFRISDTTPALTTIPSGGFLVLWADDQPAQGALHVGIKLSASGEAIGISRSGIIFADSLEYGSGGVVEPPSVNKSAGRLPDGNDNWTVFEIPTPGDANQEIIP